MTENEKEQVISDTIQRLVKNKNLKIKIIKMKLQDDFYIVELESSINNKTKRQSFGFTDRWFDPNDFDVNYRIKKLKINPNATKYQKVLLKLAYYFYTFYTNLDEKYY